MEKDRGRLVEMAVDTSVPTCLIERAVGLLTNGNVEIAGGDGGTRGFLDEKAARRYAGNISRSSLWLWRRRGLKSYPVGGRRLYRAADIDEFIVGKENL